MSAQDAKEGDSWLERWHPEAVEDPDERSPEPAPEEPALQLKLDDTGVGVTPPSARTPDGYTLKEADLRVQRAKIGYGVSYVVLGSGVAVLLAGGVLRWSSEPIIGGGEPDYAKRLKADRLLIAGAVLAGSGLVAVITMGLIHGERRHDRSKLAMSRFSPRTPRRVHWDLARSRLVF